MGVEVGSFWSMVVLRTICGCFEVCPVTVSFVVLLCIIPGQWICSLLKSVEVQKKKEKRKRVLLGLPLTDHHEEKAIRLFIIPLLLSRCARPAP